MLHSIKKREVNLGKLQDINKLKEKLAFLSKKKTQQEFNDYINSLEDEEVCKHMSNMRDIINLCNNHLFDCKFKSKERFKFEKKLKPECKREYVLRLKSIL